MTIIPSNEYGEDMIPKYRYRPSCCPQCGATYIEEAENICRQTQGIDGDYHCDGEENSLNPFGVKWSKKGRACQLVNKDARIEAKALDDWCREQCRN